MVSGKVPVQAGLALPEEVVRQRRGLARTGVVAVSVALEPDGGAPVEIRVSGWGIALDPAAERAVAAAVRRAVLAPPEPSGSARDEAAIGQEEAVRRAVRRKVKALAGVRPEVVVHLLRS